MRVVTLDEFLSNSKEFVGDARNLVVASYGQIMGYPDGLTIKEIEGNKHAKVSVGGVMFNGMNFLGLCVNDDIQMSPLLQRSII